MVNLTCCPMHLSAHPVQRLICTAASLIALAAAHVSAAPVPPPRSPDEVLVVCNENSRISKAVGDDYAQQRGVHHQLSVRCEDSAVSEEHETISFETYRKAIEAPVKSYLAQHPEIQFIVLTKGVPIRIHGAETGERPDDSPANRPLDTCLDSHLAALDYTSLPEARKLHITGSGATGLGWANRYWNHREPFSHAKFGGYLVTRLDGYTEADAKALVRQALQAEQTRPTGSVLLDVQPGFGLGDKSQVPKAIIGNTISDESPWHEYNADMARAYDLLKACGIPAELDLNEKFVGARAGLAGYFSFGSNDSRFSKRAYASLKFAPGSISDTAVSTSGRTFLPTKGGQSMMADLVAHGLTCAKAYTDEPLLQAMASPTIVSDMYFSGFTMAESFYAASQFVGWQDVVIGDPLCAPYRPR